MSAALLGILLVGCVMGVLGHLTGRELATGGYRIVEDEATRQPGNPWWTGPATGVLAAAATAVVPGAGGWAALPAYLLFAWLTIALIWIDLDVHRLPVGLVIPGGAAIAGLLGVAALDNLVSGRGAAAIVGAGVGALVMGTVYVLLGILPGGGVGGGDIRLAPVIGALLGFLGTAELIVGLLGGFLVGGVAAFALLVLGRAGLKSSIAYGPAMCLGAWGAVLGTDRILTAMLLA